jgi:hypothetical protein
VKNITVTISVEGEPHEAIPIIEQLGNVIRQFVPTSHTATIKFFVVCERCGEAMRLRGKRLVCLSCEADEETERAAYQREWDSLQPVVQTEEPAELEF